MRGHCAIILEFETWCRGDEIVHRLPVLDNMAQLSNGS